MRLVWHLCLAAATWSAPQMAQADESEDKRQRARQLFEQAEVDYRLGRFQPALDAYSEAYELAPLPGFLFNIGQCHRKLGNLERAIFFFKGYLNELPDAGNRTVVEELITECEAKRAEQARSADLENEQQRRQQEQQQRERQLALEKAKAEAQARAQSARASAVEAAARLKAAERPPKPTPFYKTWWFWTIVSTAAVAAAGGTAWALSADDRRVLPAGSLGTVDWREP